MGLFLLRTTQKHIVYTKAYFLLLLISRTGCSSGAWIITGGTSAGVMKHVGMAVRDYTLSSSSPRGKIVAIGVTPWGTVHNRQCLINPRV